MQMQPAPEKPFVVITEQPRSNALRFRYECEGRSAGSIPGVNSTPESKTFPTIAVRGYKGRAVVVVSCVTKDAPYRPHPHNLVGKGSKKGVCTAEMNSITMSQTFPHLGIQCVKKKDVEESLRLRQSIQVDPFKTGYGHIKQPSSIDFNAIRICFQVFLEGQQSGRFTEPLQPVVSEVIYDKKATADLMICDLSDDVAPIGGGKEITLLCEKVTKEDISVRFYEEQQGEVVWEGVGEFQHKHVHKQVAISFKTPQYRTLQLEQPVMIYIQLRRPSDGATSDPLPFKLIPYDIYDLSQKYKRQKLDNWEFTEVADYQRHQLLSAPAENDNVEGNIFPPYQYHDFAGTYRNPHDVTSPADHSFMTANGGAAPLNNVFHNAMDNDFQMGPQNGYASHGTNLGNLGNGGFSMTAAPQIGPAEMQINAKNIGTNKYNLCNLLDLDITNNFNMNSSEIKSIMKQLSDIKQEPGQQDEENLSNSFSKLTC
ncbi:embryonic polarity protein dorsal-like [Toxorhynchites rutilus septentrionalis]|uniref:embryonic polarity protein dorsal-like n=1 Tax=Toxorhynchites rutilus septentrionalis TaxID=329112 RepID=UPI00247A13E5|nr:embryonic polarity protein dorsal-like [Toxorhynchites rutilus septentrionalis]XP_055639565.1 embryonic polarity protein dorsal-like [Toxorhynchites rutilus septentrionalis]XP_055639567.1 embryonic polarity protein dorsal-like [Toxorhynchites rutilus septentrionalis]